MNHKAPELDSRELPELSRLEPGNRFIGPAKMLGEEYEFMVEQGKRVYIRAKEFSSPNTDATKTTLYLPGFGYKVDSDTIRILCQPLADHYKEAGIYTHATYSISAQTEKGEKDQLGVEAEALFQFLRQKRVKEVTIVGQSLGGPQVMKLARLIEEKAPEMQLRGLVLLSSSSLYSVDPKEFLKDYVSEVTKPPSRDFSPIEKANASFISKEGLRYVLEELLAGRLRPVDVLGLARTKSADLAAIHAPVVLIEGAQDKLSQVRRIIPKSGDQGSSPGYATTEEERQKILHGLFPNSSYVKLLVGEKRGTHGLAISRPTTVANVALGTLDRWWGAQPTS